MTNLRDALEKAGVTPESIAPLATPAADISVDSIVDDMAKLVGQSPADNAAHPSVEDDRPKLVEDSSAFSGVVDRIEQLVTGGPAPAVTDNPSATEPTAEAEPTADPESSPNEDASTTGTAESQPQAVPAAPPVNLDSIPMLKTDELTGSAADAKAAAEEVAAASGSPQPTGGFAEVLQSIDELDDGASRETDMALPAAGVEVPSYDPLGVEDEMAVDPDQTAAYDEYDEYELLTAPTTETDPAPDADATVDPNDFQSTPGDFNDSATDTVGFKPSLVPRMSPGRAVSVTTTEEASNDDSVTTANEIAGDYEPQDLDHWEQGSADSSKAIDAPEDTEETGPSFLETTNLQFPETPAAPADEAHRPSSSSGTAAAAILAAASLKQSTEKIESEPEPAKPLYERVEASPIALESAPRSNETVPHEDDTPLEPIPSISSIASIAEEVPTAFEQHLLLNLTTAPCSDQYFQMADAALNPDRASATKSICFVSVDSASHATEVVAHLGVIFSTKKDKRVLLVDASDSPDSLTRAFRKDKQPGLKNMTSVSDDWADMVLNTAIPNLFLMPHGWRRGGGSHWDAGGFAGLIPLFRKQFDLTLIDAGVADRTEDTPFYAACDRTLMVSRLGQTDRNMAIAVKNGLRNADVKLDGCVVTNLPA